MKKKLFSTILLSFGLLFSVLSVPASAETINSPPYCKDAPPTNWCIPLD